MKTSARNKESKEDLELYVRRKYNIPNYTKITINKLPDIVGKGYGSFWKTKRRYRAVKGSRGSKKSCTMALWTIYKMTQERYKLANVLVIRKVYSTHKDSTYAQLKWAVHQLGMDDDFLFKTAPLEIIYKPTGQKIMFRGLDDPMSITSITVSYGVLCWVWWEEAFQVTREDDFNKVDMSIRGAMPKGYFKQHTLTFNPWSDKHWLKARFFDEEDEDTFAITTTYKCNEWLDKSDIKIFEKMKENNPRRYQVEGEGEWGISEGLVYENWEVLDFDYKQLIRQNINIYGKTKYKARFGLDFGFTNDPSAFIACLVDEDKKEIYIFDEFYRTGMTNKMIANQIKYMRYNKERILADCAEPKSIFEIKELGIARIKACKKSSDSVRAGIQKLRDYKIYIHPKCENTIVEMSNYIWETDRKTGRTLNEPIGEFNHLMDALRYATQDIAGFNFNFN